MITVGLVATLLCANWGAPSAKIVQKGLDTPVSFQSGPARLPAVLTDLGHRLGWRVTVHSSLNKAIVVVSVKDKPVKELLDRLADGIGARWNLEDETLNFQLGSVETAGNAEMQAQHAKVLSGYLAWWLIATKNDSPISKEERERAIALSRDFVRGEAQINRDAILAEALEIINRNPQERLAARLFNAVGPQLLAQALSKDTATLTLSDLSEEGRKNAETALANYRNEQFTWLRTFDELNRYSAAGWATKQAVENQPPASVNGFRMAFKKGASPVTLQLLTGGQVSSSSAEFLPNEQAVSWLEQIRPFDPEKVPQAMVSFNEEAKTLTRILTSTERPIPYDGDVTKCLKDLANPLAVDPLALTRVQLLPPAAEAIKRNLVAYIDDILMSQAMQPIDDATTQASLALRQLQIVRGGMGLREEGGWILSGPRRPQSYLTGQLDRQTLAKVAANLPRPKLMTFGEYFDLQYELGDWMGYVSPLVDVLHPGYWTLHRFYEIQYVINSLTGPQRQQAAGGGLDVSKLNDWAFQRLRNVAIRSIPLVGEAKEELIPTEVLRKGRIKVEISEPVEGFLVRAFYGQRGADTSYPPKMYGKDGYYKFYALSSCKSSQEMLTRLGAGWAWPSKQTFARIVIEVPGFQPIKDRKAEQFTADLDSRPQTGAQLSSWLTQYYGK